ncbi:MAG TPA: tripartite tricarboxylate transporter substrate binding protein [Burkholderiaceae bacterium]
MREFRLRVKALALACAAVLPWWSAAAQAADSAAWPTRPVTLVVPYPPGGTSDVVGRELAKRLQEELGPVFLVDNRSGAATAIGAGYVAHAPKDGYTLLLSAGTTFTTNPHLNDKLPYKLEDFAPVAAVCTVPFAFVVKKDLPAKTLGEYVAYAKANPGKINNGTNGQGSMVHLLGEMIANGLAIKVTEVHYKGASPATMDMIAGVIDTNVEALTSAVPNVNAGQYRALAVLSAERQPLMPSVPTFKELGYPGIVGETWYAVFAPVGTPQPVIDKLGVALKKITTSEGFGAAMRKIGNEAKSSATPAELLAVTQQQSKMWGDLIKKLDIKPE